MCLMPMLLDVFSRTNSKYPLRYSAWSPAYSVVVDFKAVISTCYCCNKDEQNKEKNIDRKIVRPTWLTAVRITYFSRYETQSCM